MLFSRSPIFFMQTFLEVTRRGCFPSLPWKFEYQYAACFSICSLLLTSAYKRQGFSRRERGRERVRKNKILNFWNQMSLCIWKTVSFHWHILVVVKMYVYAVLASDSAWNLMIWKLNNPHFPVWFHAQDMRYFGSCKRSLIFSATLKYRVF